VFPLYHDEDALQGALVRELRRRGFDCVTANEAGMRGRADAEQLAFATSEGRVLYTKNTADFRRLDAAWRIAGRHHAGIVVVTSQRASVGSQVRALVAMAQKFGPDDMTNRLEFLLNHLPR
jgi:uncharacterized protein with PIN domain